jgi:hypothetical protein
LRMSRDGESVNEETQNQGFLTKCGQLFNIFSLTFVGRARLSPKA